MTGIARRDELKNKLTTYTPGKMEVVKETMERKTEIYVPLSYWNSQETLGIWNTITETLDDKGNVIKRRVSVRAQRP